MIWLSGSAYRNPSLFHSSESTRREFLRNPHTHLISDDGVYMALRSYFQSAVACVRGESGPSSVNSILTPLGPVALATTHCLPTVRGSPTVTPRRFKAAIVAFISSTCNPK